MPIEAFKHRLSMGVDAFDLRSAITPNDSASHPSDRCIFEVGKVAGGTGQFQKLPEDRSSDRRRKIVERQSADREIEGRWKGDFLDRPLMQLHFGPLPVTREVWIDELRLQILAERIIDLDEVVFIARSQRLENHSGEGATSRADFENPPGAAALSKTLRDRQCQSF